MKKVTFIAFTERGIEKALKLQKEYPKSLIVTTHHTENDRVSIVTSIQGYLDTYFTQRDAFCFIGALGICVRMIAPHLSTKQEDPPVVCVDDHGLNVQAVIGGHQGGANDFAKKVATILGANPVISTSSDLQEIWNLDLLARRFSWSVQTNISINDVISLFVNNKQTALLLEVKDEGTSFLERTAPSFVSVFYQKEAFDPTEFDLIIAITYRILKFSAPSIIFHPKCLHIGTGCSKELDDKLFETTLKQLITKKEIALASVASFGSINIKEKQQAYLDFSENNQLPFVVFSPEKINEIAVPNPSLKVRSKIGVDSVAEATALLLSNNKNLIVEKQKVTLDNGQKFTFAIAIAPVFERSASIAIIGAGPGDEELITVKGKQYLEQADCVLYAGSLIPEEMTHWCKSGAVVRNSATMTLEEQITLIEEHYHKGHLIVRLQCGDPSLYGAIQEQMSIFDDLGMNYFIVPGISSFSAAAAVLKSEFTIPEVVQSIVLTRGEGKTPMPPKEQLSTFAQTHATMCIFLSAGIAAKVQKQLLEHFEEDTPVAVLYRLTWKDEEIFRGKLCHLAQIVKESKKTRTVLIIVGKAIGARKNRSQLYNPDWQHIFRTHKKFVVKN